MTSSKAETGKKEDKKVLNFTRGSYVIVDGEETSQENIRIYKKILDDIKSLNVPLRVDGNKSNDGLSIVVYPTLVSQQLGVSNGLYITTSILKSITDEERIDLEKKLAIEIEKRNKVALESIIDPIVPFTKRVVPELSAKDYISTNVNFLCKGKLNTEGVAFVGTPTPHLFAGCCSVTKTKEDFIVYIPKVWTSYYGYAKKDLERWVRFINESEIGAELKMLPDGKCEGMRASKNMQQGSCCISENDNYVISLKGGKSKMLTYMHFILLRYIYNLQYWNIPITAMKIKHKLRNKVTNFQAILLAHLRYGYHGYYCLVDQPSYGKVQVFQDRSNCVSKINSDGYNMNKCFDYIGYNRVNITTMESFFKTEDWNGLLEFVLEMEKKKRK